MSKWMVFWSGAAVALLFVLALVKVSPVVDYGKQAENLIQQCQKDLPRTQYCTIIAVPNEETEE